MLPSVQSKDMMLLEQKEHITKEQHYRMLEACTKYYNDQNTKLGKVTLYNQFLYERDYFFMLTLWNTAARIGDVCKLKTDNYDTYNKRVKFIVEKKSEKNEDGIITFPQYHTIILEDSYILAFHNYIKKWGIEGYLFTSVKMHGEEIIHVKALSDRQARNRIYKYATIADIKVNPHMYRHGVAIEMLNNEIPIEIISKYLGHSNIETTVKFYAKITPEITFRYIQDKMRIN